MGRRQTGRKPHGFFSLLSLCSRKWESLQFHCSQAGNCRMWWLYVSEWIKLHVNSIIIQAIIPLLIYHTLANNSQPSTVSFATFRIVSASCRVNNTECLCTTDDSLLVAASEPNPTQTGLRFHVDVVAVVCGSKEFYFYKVLLRENCLTFFCLPLSLLRFFPCHWQPRVGEDNGSGNVCEIVCGFVVADVGERLTGTEQQLKAKTKATEDINVTATNVPFTCLIYFRQLRKRQDKKSCHRAVDVKPGKLVTSKSSNEPGKMKRKLIKRK